MSHEHNEAVKRANTVITLSVIIEHTFRQMQRHPGNCTAYQQIIERHRAEYKALTGADYVMAQLPSIQHHNSHVSCSSTVPSESTVDSSFHSCVQVQVADVQSRGGYLNH